MRDALDADVDTSTFDWWKRGMSRRFMLGWLRMLKKTTGDLSRNFRNDPRSNMADPACGRERSEFRALRNDAQRFDQRSGRCR